MLRSILLSFTPCSLIMSLTLSAHATTISLNFATGINSAIGGSDTPDNMAPATQAGAVIAANWNNLHLTSGSLGSLQDSTGTTTTASANWASNGTYVTGSGDLNGNSQMMNTEIDQRASTSDFGNPAVATVSVSSLPANLSSYYNVLVYYAAVSSPSVVTSSYNIGSTTYYTDIPAHSQAFSGSFVRETNTTPGGHFTSGANFVEFTGLSGSGFTLTVDPLGYRGEITGIQISNVPEPGTCVLLSLGVVALFGLRLRTRRAAAR